MRLTLRGVRQAHTAADELSRHNPVLLLSSDLKRACQTARIIAARLALPFDHTPLLRERHWGVYEGRPASEGHQAESAISPNEAVPQGESRNEVAERLHRLLPLLAPAQGPIVLVTHGDVIREGIRLWADGPDEYPLGNGCIIKMSGQQAAPQPSWTLSRNSE
ncbi:histidine phosphatase family protein [Candidatus Mycolicibacterium alkanivorans]|uniref:Histidine phosphatase family protein n=1 Tax=Candidatus Mycolicibacterium alkanivorans TaxID=2954114 RepID=A0ABS9YX43_9MYCO|nr:histidine phosphatase family protein [Candidatus Mycolicibacterium alkanivorans]